VDAGVMHNDYTDY